MALPGIGGVLLGSGEPVEFRDRVASVTPGTSSTVGTSASYALPTYAPGDMLVVVVASLWISAISVNTPAGWNLAGSAAFGSGSTTTIRRLAVFWKIADGSEGTSLTITTGTKAFSVVTAYSVIGGKDVAVAFGALTTATSLTPPTLALAWPGGAAVAVSAQRLSSGTAPADFPPSGLPAGFDNLTGAAKLDGSTPSFAAYNADAVLPGDTSVSPSAFTYSGSRYRVAATIGIRGSD